MADPSLGSIAYGRRRIRYHVLERSGRRTLTIEVHPDGRVVVRAPVGCPAALVAERVNKRAAWITRQLSEFEDYTPRTPARQYIAGESHLYLGRQYRLSLLSGDENGVSLTRGRLLVHVDGQPQPSSVRAMLQAWYAERARAVFRQVLDEARSRFRGPEPGRLLVRAMRTRWGSLSAAGTMTLNVDLIRARRGHVSSTWWCTNSVTSGTGTTTLGFTERWRGPCPTGSGASVDWRWRCCRSVRWTS